MIGSIAGVLVFYAVLFFEKVRVDDPVGAISVHGVCGAFGTLGAALFHENLFLGKPYDLMGQLTTQALGVFVTFAWTFTTCFVLFKGIALTIGLRVSPEEEVEGLDLAEHGASSYPDFVVSGLTAGAPAMQPVAAASPAPVPDAQTAEA
jgi:Amt family ammonium transporter